MSSYNEKRKIYFLLPDSLSWLCTRTYEQLGERAQQLFGKDKQRAFQLAIVGRTCHLQH
jgi:hypothetical protein